MNAPDDRPGTDASVSSGSFPADANPMRNLHQPLVAMLLAVLICTGCGVLYRQPIYQGNLLEPSAVEQLQVGMTRQQVQALLGTPSISDPFHHDRWDYVATQRTNRRGTIEVRNFTLWFEADQLVRWDWEHFPEQDEALADSARRQFGPNLARDKDDR